MNRFDIIEKAVRERRATLTEAEARAVLRVFNILVVKEKIYKDINELEKESAEVSCPVVLKGLGSKLTHKTEKGLVKLNIGTSEDLEKAAVCIKDAAGRSGRISACSLCWKAKENLWQGFFLTHSMVRRLCLGWEAYLRRP